MDLLFGPGPIAVVQNALGPGWAPWLHATSQLGSTTGIMLVVMMAFWGRGRALAYALVSAAAIGSALTALGWTLLDLPRPDDPTITVHRLHAVPSFPSGHVVTTVVLWGLLVRVGAVPWPLAAAMLGIEMLSRLYLAAHFLGDVLGGLVFGAVALAVHARLWPAFAARAVRWPLAVWFALGALAVGAALAAIPWLRGHPDEDLWLTVGMVVGGVGAAAAEWCWVRYSPDGHEPSRQLARAAIGLAGLIVLGLGAVALLGQLPMGPSAAACACAWALWGWFGAPVLLVRVGLARSAAPRPRRAATAHP